MWTKTRPTKHGFYWYQQEPEEEIEVIFFDRETYQTGSDVSVEMFNGWDCGLWWSVPLTAPAQPEPELDMQNHD